MDVDLGDLRRERIACRSSGTSAWSSGPRARADVSERAGLAPDVTVGPGADPGLEVAPIVPPLPPERVVSGR